MSDAKMQELLDKYKLNAAAIDRETFITSFTDQMEKGLTGQESSLDMVPTYIRVAPEIPADRELLVLDAGGTNLRIARARFDNEGNIALSDFQKYRMPGTEGSISKEKFFTLLGDLIMPLLGDCRRIGFCFSYPSEITPDHDGIVLRLVKEIAVEGLEGERVAKNLIAQLVKRGAPEDLSMVIVNDSVTSLLSGLTARTGLEYSGYVGLILGTGCNISYPEIQDSITKLVDVNGDERMVINMEAANFNKYDRGAIDLEYDNGTALPGVHVLEKMISGAYLGDLILLAAKKAAEENVFSDEAADSLAKTESLPTVQLNDLLTTDDIISLPKDDMEKLRYLTEVMIERAGLLTALALSAVFLKTGFGKEQKAPLCLVADGTTFYKLRGLKTAVESYLAEILTGDRLRYYDIATVDDGPVVGAAIAALTN